MKPGHDPRAYLFDMLESAERISDYVSDMTFEDFWESEITRDAVSLRLAMIGEAATRVDKRTEKKFSSIPFVEIRGLRNRIVHDYGATNFRVVWKIAREDLPPLIKELKAALQAQ